MNTHQCSMSLRCKSKECRHAVPHDSKGCDFNAPCGCWPGRRDFKPMVACIPIEQVKAPEDCPDCGKSEAKGHHPKDCITELNRRLAMPNNHIRMPKVMRNCGVMSKKIEGGDV